MKYKVAAACFVGMTMVCLLTSARAEENNFAVVVMVDDKEVVFDKGTRAGVKTGNKVRLYRRITVHHPITGEEIIDKFPIGDVQISQASELLSIVKNSRKLSHRPKVGDLVRLPEPKDPAKKPAKAKGKPKLVPQEAVPVELDPEIRDLNAVLVGNMGRPITKRIFSYTRFLFKYPDSAYAPTVAREIEWLKTLNKKTKQPAQAVVARGATKTKRVGIKVIHPEIGPLEVGDRPQFIVAVLPVDPATRVHLYIREEGKEGFDQIEMVHGGSFYYRAHLPRKYVSDSGDLLYFIEVSAAEDGIVPGVATETNPNTIKVTRPTVDRIERSNRTTATAVFEYVNFDMDDKVDDEYMSFEADVFYRIRTFLYGVRVGTGVFNGTGGNLGDIEESRDNNEKLAALYGYIEGEFEIVPLFHFMIRGLAGNQREPGNEENGTDGVFGLEGGIRIGEETKTNLALSGAIFEDIGYEGRIDLTINRFRKVPILIEGLVTNFPVDDSHVGLRLVVGIGYRFTDWFAILARGSWNARTIKHTGFGGGASVALSW